MSRVGKQSQKRPKNKGSFSTDSYPIKNKVTIVGILLFTILCLYFYYGGVLKKTAESIENFFYTKTSSYGLRIKKITIKGCHKTSVQDVLHSLGIKEGDPLLKFNINEAFENLQKLPWIDDVILQRHWPDCLQILVKERFPIALWQHHHKISVVDQKGHIILDDDAIDLYESHKNLFFISGEGAPDAVNDLLKVLKEFPVIQSFVKGAIRIGKRRWNLVLKNSLVILLPEDNIHESLKKLVKLQKNYTIFEKAKKTLDLRIAGKLIVSKL